MLTPVILSGGAGTRLWPLSRELYPKQLLALVGDRTMLQTTVSRLERLETAPPIVICNEDHRFLVAEQLRVCGQAAAAIILEPTGRNTAPAIALAAHQAMRGGNDPLLLVLPADHVIKDVKAFEAAVLRAKQAAETGLLVTFGIVPDAPETGYGYIRRGKQMAGDNGGWHSIAAFVEKPDAARAAQFLASGDYYWNSGMFVFRASRYLEELNRFAPDIAASCERAMQAVTHDLDFTRVEVSEFAACRSESIDYAVMEKTDSAAVVPLAAGWSDVGSWGALRAVLPADEHGNVLRGDVVLEGCSGSYVHAESRLVAAIGLEGYVVVETKDAVLVAPLDQVQHLKSLVNRIKQQGRTEHLLHRKVSRPWGSYDSIDNGDRFQVKRLTVNPGATLSLQLHHHRAEHWIIVSGTARITCDEKVFLLEENQSTYIPVGAKHRIENPGRIPLHLIEVQSGAYLGEDDIVRFEDRYGREGTNK
ncbi:MAG: mannose-1-phosphate guanylyltransferase/mannose-6-phosphate isomerase [Steroidobacteraceae bacterium]